MELGADRIPRVEEISLNPLRKMRILEGKLDEILAAAPRIPGAKISSSCEGKMTAPCSIPWPPPRGL